MPRPVSWLQMAAWMVFSYLPPSYPIQIGIICFSTRPKFICEHRFDRVQRTDGEWAIPPARIIWLCYARGWSWR